MDRFDRIIDCLYDGVADAQAWHAALTELRDATRAHHAILMARRTTPSADDFCAASGVAPDHLDNFVRAATSGPADWLKVLPCGNALDFQAVIPRQEFVRTDFFNDAIRPMHGYRAIVSIPVRDEAADSFLALCRPEHAVDFDTEQTALVNRLVPHVTRALRAKLRMDRAAMITSCAFGLIDEMDAGVAVVDGGLRPAVVNQALQGILDSQDGLHLRGDRLVAHAPMDHARLESAIRKALADDVRAPGQYALTLRRRALLPPWVAVVRRLPSRPGDKALAALIVENAARRPAHLEAFLAEVFELTPREAALAAHLAYGRDLDAAAAAMGIGLGTVRNHLKAIFAKTVTRRQGELVSLLLRVARLSR
ncbi:MAG: helix-turn-helix transcriptional regulator [Propionivibrio sp.]|uniref:helix-turn-helix transcriptional regulator n=1 Tax=Propionivibrio sp. TaxID=2212460 RepID=UPI0025D52070|nr:helix-turn-helix transcriptional regulator [Propionivibrio sp.]MBL0206781.1 helix-turn-helix transcriptional regulator [Propionivibrio sp.]